MPDDMMWYQVYMAGRPGAQAPCEELHPVEKLWVSRCTENRCNEAVCQSTNGLSLLLGGSESFLRRRREEKPH